MKYLIANEIKKSLNEEVITEDILACVDLNIEYSPVIAIRGEKTLSEVIKCESGYFVKHPLVNKIVNEDELKIMRCRYLMNR